MADVVYEQNDDHSLEKWLGMAFLASLVFHALLFLVFRGMILEMGRPSVDPIDPPRFRLEQSTIDPKYLSDFSETPKGHSSQVTREPINLELGEVVSFAGSLEAPSIPLPRIEQSVPSSLSAGDLSIPRPSFSALPVEAKGNIPQVAQAMDGLASTAALDSAHKIASQANILGGTGQQYQGVGLPGADDISALIKPSSLVNVDLRKPDFQPILIRFNSELLFDFGSDQLTDSAVEKLGRVADFIRQAVDLKVTVEGHTDSIDTDEFNLDLSRRRAQAVADWFVSTAAIDRASLTVIGYGESRPLVDQTGDPSSERLNRRVEIRIEGKR